MPAFPRLRPIPRRRPPATGTSGSDAVVGRTPASALPVRPPVTATPPQPTEVDGCFARRGWTPFAFQREVRDAVARAECGLPRASSR